MAEKNKLSLSVQFADTRLAEALPRPSIRAWVKASLFASAELTIRFVDAEEGRALNRDYRGKDYATNVLTFAYDEAGNDAYAESEVSDTVHADIVLCTEVLLSEAAERKLPVQQHAAHLIVHGILHAQGYDHEEDAEATEMENLETEILAGLGIADPYAEIE